jgi:hypothetical protein
MLMTYYVGPVLELAGSADRRAQQQATTSSEVKSAYNGGLPVDFTASCKAILEGCKTVFPTKN